MPAGRAHAQLAAPLLHHTTKQGGAKVQEAFYIFQVRLEGRSSPLLLPCCAARLVSRTSRCPHGLLQWGGSHASWVALHHSVLVAAGSCLLQPCGGLELPACLPA